MAILAADTPRSTNCRCSVKSVQAAIAVPPYAVPGLLHRAILSPSIHSIIRIGTV